LDDELTPNNQEEQKRCAKLKGDLDTYKWDGLRDHTDIAIDDDLWRQFVVKKRQQILLRGLSAGERCQITRANVAP
ncbi:hypothetical protein, partial [Escherichia coli]|uniref:hypothetical protein n=1 Tax=Escherichia coli TaxID=562 RepID=UPI003D2F28EB